MVTYHLNQQESTIFKDYNLKFKGSTWIDHKEGSIRFCKIGEPSSSLFVHREFSPHNFNLQAIKLIFESPFDRRCWTSFYKKILISTPPNMFTQDWSEKEELLFFPILNT